ncbi:MAG: YncE family protein [Chlamydiales bacterium]|nr:YncE family protein [Chlamydiales bacterium]
MKFYYLFFCIIITKILSASPFIWAADYLNNRVLVIDAATNTIFQTIPQSTGLFDHPVSVAITPDGLFAYVFNGTTGSNHTTVSVINTATYQRTALISFTGLGNRSTTSGSIAISPNGEFAYITNGTRGTLNILDISTNSLVHTTGVFSSPQGIAFSPDSAFAYVADTLGNQVYRIDTSTYTITTPFTGVTFSEPVQIAITSDGFFAYVTNLQPLSSKVSVLNLTDNTETAAIPLDSAQGIVLSPDGSNVYVSGIAVSKIFIIDTLTNTLVKSISKPDFQTPNPLAIHPNGNILYIANIFGPILAFNTSTTTVIATVPNTAGGEYDYSSLAIQPSGKARAFARPSNRRP